MRQHTSLLLCSTTGLCHLLLQGLHDNLTTKRIASENSAVMNKSTVPLLRFVHAATGDERIASPCNVRLKSAAVA